MSAFNDEIDEFGLQKLFEKTVKEARAKHDKDICFLQAQRKLQVICIAIALISLLAGLTLTVIYYKEDYGKLPLVAQQAFNVLFSLVIIGSFSICLLKAMVIDAKQRLLVWHIADLEKKERVISEPKE